MSLFKFLLQSVAEVAVKVTLEQFYGVIEMSKLL